MLTEAIISRLSILTTGDMKASGLKVLSDEYSYPKSTTLTFLILPIVLEDAIIFASLPLSVLKFLNCGNFL